jgi:hydroxyversicolorone monooxygenase
MKAIQEPNVDVHFTAASHITADGVVGADGVERKCDTIVCATGNTPSPSRTPHYNKID